MHQISTVENPAAKTEVEDIPDLKSETSKDKWYDYDEYMEPPDAGEMCDDQSDISDFEETYIKKRKRKGKVLVEFFVTKNSSLDCLITLEENY